MHLYFNIAALQKSDTTFSRGCLVKQMVRFVRGAFDFDDGEKELGDNGADM
jgi:hypothetical protein